MNHLVAQLKPATGEAIVLMPFARALVESQTTIGRLSVYPPGELELDKLNVDITLRRGLVDAQSSMTGFSAEIFEDFPSVGFCIPLTRDRLDYNDHEADLTLLTQLAGLADRSFDLLRMNYCRLDLPDTLPSPIGVWDVSLAYVGALVYLPSDNAWYAIAGQAAQYASVVSGIGLDFDGCEIHFPPPSATDGEVGAIAEHALSLFSDAMHARNDTAKFVRCMTLLEFIGSPDKYENWKKLKGDIICHIAHDKADYLRRSDELRSFAGLKSESGVELGYRTLVVHHGKFIEDILPKHRERQKLFQTLQMYCQAVIGDMIENASMSWGDFLDLRVQKKKGLGILPGESE